MVAQSKKLRYDAVDPNLFPTELKKLSAEGNDFFLKLFLRTHFF